MKSTSPTMLLETSAPQLYLSANRAPLRKEPVYEPKALQLQTTDVEPVRIEQRGAVYFADFGKAAFGNLRIVFTKDVPAGTLTVRLGEKLDAAGAIDRQPPGSVNYRKIVLTTVAGQCAYQLDIAPTKRHREDNRVINTPPGIGYITPFRYAEIENCPVALESIVLSQGMVHAPFDDEAAQFASSAETLNAVWELCKHTMKATTAFGLYIDGDRERIPYEADAYINQLSHYACDLDPRVARATVAHLLAHPTWPTEWMLHMPMMATVDYEMTGDPTLGDRYYDELRKKLLTEKARGDGLLRALAIVDWPSAERDGYNVVEGVNHPTAQGEVGPEVNTVVNAFYYHALGKMDEIAGVTGREADAQLFAARAKQVYQSFNTTFFDTARGIYTDGEGSAHASLHANMFALAFDLVPVEHHKTVADFVQSRGMACSVYGSQYLLEALYKAGKDDYALQLMTSHSDRGWWHMIELGSTMTLEAWDVKYKNNLTWNHAWGAAPANIISRYLLGVRPIRPGYTEMLIAPQPGSLKWARGHVPTPFGPVTVNIANGNVFHLEVSIPLGTRARIQVPRRAAGQVTLNGKPCAATAEGQTLVVDFIEPGKYIIESR